MSRRLEPDPDALNPLIQNIASIETKIQGSSAGAGGQPTCGSSPSSRAGKTLEDEKKLESGMNNLRDAISATQQVSGGGPGPLSVPRPYFTTRPGDVNTESLYSDH